jgi:hypothetical protein
MIIHRLGLLLIVALLLAPTVEAQTVPFGKNKVQYRSFQWKVLAGDHVDVYYYPEEEPLARLTLVYAEETVRDLSRTFQHHPFERIPLIVYASRHHFEQTNVYSGLIPESVLGFTEYLRGRIALPFRGDYAQFRATLRHELVHAFQRSKLAETRAVFPRQLRFSPQQVQWWTEGLAEYLAAPEPTTQATMFVRDMVLNGRVPSIREFTRGTGYAAYPMGAELHRYLADRFGGRYLVELYETYWKYPNFEAALEGVLGLELDALSGEWHSALQQRFFPTYSQRSPPEVAVVPIIFEMGGNVKPTLLGDSVPELFFLSGRSGYTSLYRTPLGQGERGVELVLQGEHRAQFESLYATESGIDAHERGFLALVARYLDRDALVILEIESGGIGARYQWPDLVGIKSPAWDPAGDRIVFEGLSTGGISDLYMVDLRTHQRTRLTADRFRDTSPDWSPDGQFIVFASDRTTFGGGGHVNLFLLDLVEGSIRYLTHGPWTDQAPRWSRDGRQIAFTSDREGVADLYAIDLNGEGRRLTHLTGGAFDPDWLPGDSGLIFTGYSEGAFRIYRLTFGEDTVAAPRISLAEAIAEALEGAESTPPPPRTPTGWDWAELQSPFLEGSETHGYRPWNRFSVDVAGGEAFIAPGTGAAQGAQLLASDMLGNHMLFANISAFRPLEWSGLLNRISGSLLYLNLAGRLNYGAGLYRVSALTRDVELELHEDVGHGGYLFASYPFSRFRRVEVQFGVERNQRGDVADPDDPWSPRPVDPERDHDRKRTGLLASNHVAYINDETRWVATGPIEGVRFNLTAGFVTCFACRIQSDVTGERLRQGVSAEKVFVSADYRRYFRTARSSAYAVRAYAFVSEGTLPALAALGGPHRLRGYPRHSMAGSRVALLNQEWRFPVLDDTRLDLPIRSVRVPGIQGAIFLDAGSSWSHERSLNGVWGSYGVGLRSALAPPIVLRLDVGRRYRIGEPAPAPLDENARFGQAFLDLYFGYNY